MPTQWFPTDWDYTFTAAGKAYTFKSINPALDSAATPPAGLDLDVVWVGTGTAADYAGRDVKGKAVLIHSIPEPGSMGHTAAVRGGMARAFQKGAAAVGVVYGISDNFAIWQALGNAGDAGVAPRGPITIPGFYMGYNDGKVIRDLIGAGQPVKLKMRLSVEHARRSDQLERLGHAARDDRRKHHRDRASGRLLRSVARQRVGPVGDDGAPRLLLADPEGTAAPVDHVRRDGQPPSSDRRAPSGCTTTATRCSRKRR